MLTDTNRQQARGQIERERERKTIKQNTCSRMTQKQVRGAIFGCVESYKTFTKLDFKMKI